MGMQGNCIEKTMVSPDIPTLSKKKGDWRQGTKGGKREDNKREGWSGYKERNLKSSLTQKRVKLSSMGEAERRQVRTD